MNNENLDTVVELLTRLPLIMHKRILRDVFKVVRGHLGMDVTPHHIMIMKVLQESGTMHSSEIGESIMIAKPQITHSIDKLIGLGLVERQHDLKDRRKINISLTEKGKTTVEKLDLLLKNSIKTRLSSLQKGELEKLADSLRTMAEILTKIQWEVGHGNHS